MAGLNKVMIIGNLGRDPEVTYTQAGVAITKINVATSETWNDKNTGEKREKTEWHRITFFGKQAETIARYMSKGSQIYVEGRIQTSQYEKDGITRYSTDIMANNFQFLGSKGNQSQSQGQQGGFQQPQNTGGYQQNQAAQQGGFQQPQNDFGQGGVQQPQNDFGQGSAQQPQNDFGQGGFQQPQDNGFQSPPDDDIPF